MSFIKISLVIRIKKVIQNFWGLFLDLIFPKECQGCGAEGYWLCHKCFSKVNIKKSQYCLDCKLTNEFGQFCPSCQKHHSLDGVWIAADYEDQIVAKLIKVFKYHFVKDIAGDLTKILALFLNNLLARSRLDSRNIKRGLSHWQLSKLRRAPNALLNFEECLIVPVPLSAKRLRWRGFNQAEVMAEIVAAAFPLTLSRGELIRIKHKKPQAKLNEAARKINVKSCFVWRSADLAGRNVILLDDVVTTGATLNECACVLKASGAGEVWGLVVAKG